MLDLLFDLVNKIGRASAVHHPMIKGQRSVITSAVSFFLPLGKFRDELSQ